MRRHTHFLFCLVTVIGFAMTAQAQVVINEFVYDDAGGDNEEFIELYNAGGAAEDLTTWSVVLINGNGGAEYTTVTLPLTTLAAGDYYVIASASTTPNDPSIVDLVVSGGTDIQNGSPDAIVLMDENGVIQDAVAYEAGAGGLFGLPAWATEGDGINGEYSGLTGINRTATRPVGSASRIADGVDTDDNDKDFALLQATPGWSNQAPLNTLVLPYVNNGDDAAGTGYGDLWGRYVDPTATDPVTNSIAQAPGASPQGGNAIVFSDTSGGGDCSLFNVAPAVNQQLECYVYVDSTVRAAGGWVGWTIALGSAGEDYHPEDYRQGLCNGFGAIYGNNISNAIPGVVDSGAVEIAIVDRYNGADTVIGTVPVSAGVNDGWQRLLLRRVGTSVTAVVGGTYGDGGATGIVLSGTGAGLATGIGVGFRENSTPNDSWLWIDALRVGLTNEVTVDPTDGAPDNVSTFNSLMMAMHSFQTTGSVTLASPGGLGVNNGVPGINVINIVNSTPIDEVVRIDERASSDAFNVQDEAMVINGPGAIDGVPDAPSAAANAVVRPQDDIGSGDNEGFEIRTNIDLTVNNVSFIPSTSVPFGDDLVSVDGLGAKAIPNIVTFNSCVFTAADAGGLPVVNSKAEAIVDNTANIATLGTEMDDLFDPFPDAGENMVVTLRDCVLSHNVQESGRDGVVEVSGTASGAGFKFNVISSVITYVGRYGIQLSGTGNDAEPEAYTCTITGSGVGDGPVAGLGGPTIIANAARASQSFFGSTQGTLRIDNTIVGNCSERALSFDSDLDVNIADSLIDSPGVSLVLDTWSANNATAITGTTLAGGQILIGDNNSPTQVLTISDCIIANHGNAPTGAIYSNNMQIVVDDSVVYGLQPTSFSIATTVGLNVVDLNPGFVSRDPYSADFLDTSNNAVPAGAGAGDDQTSGEDDTIWEMAPYGDGEISVAVDNNDLLTSIVATFTGAGFHGATPGDDTSRLASLVDGAWAADGLTVIAADTDASSDPSIVLEYDFISTLQNADIDSIGVFSGHDGDGARVFINASVEVDTGAGYAPLTTLLTGPYGKAAPGASAAYAAYVPTAPVTGVEKLRITVENVSHNSTGFFQASDDNTTVPPTAFPNQGTILKEIDVTGVFNPASVDNWDLY